MLTMTWFPLKPFDSSDGGLIFAVVNQCANADFYVLLHYPGICGGCWSGGVGLWSRCLSPLSWIIGGSRSRVGGMDGWAVSSSWSKPKGDHVTWAAASLNHVNEGKHVGKGYTGSVQCLFSVCHNSSKRGISFSNSARPPFTNVTHIRSYLVLSSNQVSFSFCKGQDMSLLVIAANEVTSERKKRSQARKKRSQAIHQPFFRFSSPCFNSESSIAHKLQSFEHAVPPEPWRMRAVPRKWRVPWSLPSAQEHTLPSGLWSNLLQL